MQNIDIGVRMHMKTAWTSRYITMVTKPPVQSKVSSFLLGLLVPILVTRPLLQSMVSPFLLSCPVPFLFAASCECRGVLMVFWFVVFLVFVVVVVVP